MEKTIESKLPTLIQMEVVSEQLKTSLVTAFGNALDDDDFESADRIVKAYEKFKVGRLRLTEAQQKALQKPQKPQKLGSLTVGEDGQKDFGPFRLVWEVQMDHIEWSLNSVRDPQESWLTGALKYKGWNRIEVDSEISLEQQLADKKLFEDNQYLTSARPSFMVYVHEWPAFKEAMDFLYYDLGRKSAKGTYEDSFVKPGTEDKFMKVSPRFISKDE